MRGLSGLGARFRQVASVSSASRRLALAIGASACFGALVAVGSVAECNSDAQRLQRLEARVDALEKKLKQEKKTRLGDLQAICSAIETRTHLKKPVLVCFSGKRSTGKSFVTAILQVQAGVPNVSLAFADECKRLYAEKANLDLKRLMTDWKYKDSHRPGMTQFYDEAVRKDPSYFHKAVADRIFRELSKPEPPELVIVSDCRFPEEIAFFKEQRSEMFSKIITIRVTASDEVRMRRGWKPGPGDLHISEIALDNYKFDLYIPNNFSGKEEINNFIRKEILPQLHH